MWPHHSTGGDCISQGFMRHGRRHARRLGVADARRGLETPNVASRASRGIRQGGPMFSPEEGWAVKWQMYTAVKATRAKSRTYRYRSQPAPGLKSRRAVRPPVTSPQCTYYRLVYVACETMISSLILRLAT
jgi:hypothetical protein